MNIKTKYNGNVHIEQHEIWHFDNGIPGFPDQTEFIILPLPNNGVYSVLQAVNALDIAFVITNPFILYKDYEFQIDQQSLEHLELVNEKDVLIYTILTIHDPFENTTANLQAPIIFNVQNRKAKQLILVETNYTTKHPIFNQKLVDVKG